MAVDHVVAIVVASQFRAQGRRTIFRKTRKTPPPLATFSLIRPEAFRTWRIQHPTLVWSLHRLTSSQPWNSPSDATIRLEDTAGLF